MERYHSGDRARPYITAWTDTDYETTREADENDEWDRGSTTGTLVDYGVVLGIPDQKRRIIGRDKVLNESDIGFLPAVGDRVYLVIERYGSGDTFGHDDGNHRPMHVFKTQAEAEEWVKSPEAVHCQDNDYFGGHESWLIEAVTVTEK